MTLDFQCLSCNYIYNYLETNNKHFYDLPSDWVCPECGGSVDNFKAYYNMNFDENIKLWTKITESDETLPDESHTGEHCFVHSIHNDCCFRVIWQGHMRCWTSPDVYDDDVFYPLKDVDMWMLNPIPIPTWSSAYAMD